MSSIEEIERLQELVAHIHKENTNLMNKNSKLLKALQDHGVHYKSCPLYYDSNERSTGG